MGVAGRSSLVFFLRKSGKSPLFKTLPGSVPAPFQNRTLSVASSGQNVSVWYGSSGYSVQLLRLDRLWSDDEKLCQTQV